MQTGAPSTCGPPNHDRITCSAPAACTASRLGRSTPSATSTWPRQAPLIKVGVRVLGVLKGRIAGLQEFDLNRATKHRLF